MCTGILDTGDIMCWIWWSILEMFGIVCSVCANEGNKLSKYISFQCHAIANSFQGPVCILFKQCRDNHKIAHCSIISMMSHKLSQDKVSYVSLAPKHHTLGPVQTSSSWMKGQVLLWAKQRGPHYTSSASALISPELCLKQTDCKNNRNSQYSFKVVNQLFYETFETLSSVICQIIKLICWG